MLIAVKVLTGESQTIVLRISTFGGLHIERDGCPLDLPPRQARHMLAYLILNHNQPLPRDLLAGTFWPDRPNSRARRALSQALWQIRTALGPSADRLISDADHVTFILKNDDVLDLDDFEERTRGEDLAQLRQAVALYRADFLEGYYEDWALLERERLREIYLSALETLVVLHKRRGDFERALAIAQQLARADPLRESAHRELMTLYRLLNRPRAALGQYQTLCGILAEEMQAEPLPSSARLAQEIAASLTTDASPPLPFSTPTAPILERTATIPLVGRQEERAILLKSLEWAIDGRGGLLLIEGEAGIGKTRLLESLIEGANWREVPALRGRGRAGAPPYRVISEALTEALTPLRLSQITGLVDPRWLREVGRVLPALTDRRPDRSTRADLDPDQQRQRIVEGFCRLVLALGQTIPHVLILDDLQWADEATLTVLKALASRLADHRVLIVGAYRAEDARMRPIVWQWLQAMDREGEHTRVLITRLTTDKTGQLVRQGLGLSHPAPNFERRLHEETGGNPLFILETLRALHDEGLLYRDEAGAWSTPWDRAASGYTAMPLPSGVQAVIERRLDRLRPTERQLLTTASVLGNSFDFESIARIHPTDRKRTLDMMGTLIRRQLLVEEPNAYRFIHDKVQEVIYAGIEAENRRELHCRAGEMLSQVKPDSIESLAHHFWHGECWMEAMTYNHQAGRRARRVYASTAAFDYYTRAIAAWERLQDPDPSAGATLYEERGRLGQETGRLDQAGEDFEAARALTIQAEDEIAQARVLNCLSYLYFQQGTYTPAAETAQKALTLAETTDAMTEIARALFNEANAARNRGMYREAISLYKRAIALYQELDEPVQLADALNRMGAAIMLQGHYAEAHPAMTRALKLRRRLDDRVGISYSLINLAILDYFRGHFDASQQAAEEAVTLSRAIEDPYGEDAALFQLGRTRIAQGAPARAIDPLQKAIAISREIGDNLEPQALSELGSAYLHMGDLARARTAMTRALEQSSITDIDTIPQIHLHLAQLGIEDQRVDEAAQHAQASLAAIEGIDHTWTLGKLHRVLGQIKARQGDPTARDHFALSLRLLQEIGAEAEFARSQYACGCYEAQSEDPDAAQRGAALIKEARATFTRLGMAWDLGQIETEQKVALAAGQIRVRLASTEAPLGRPLREEDYVSVTWTIHKGAEEAAGVRRFPDLRANLACRRHRLLRLLDEAEEQGGAPTVRDLAEVLDVSARTVERDLAALRDAGYAVSTRGSRV